MYIMKNAWISEYFCTKISSYFNSISHERFKIPWHNFHISTGWNNPQFPLTQENTFEAYERDQINIKASWRKREGWETDQKQKGKKAKRENRMWNWVHDVLSMWACNACQCIRFSQNPVVQVSFTQGAGGTPPFHHSRESQVRVIS